MTNFEHYTELSGLVRAQSCEHERKEKELNGSTTMGTVAGLAAEDGNK